MGAALFALVTVGLRIIADRACSGYIAIRKKAVCLAIKKKLVALSDKNPFLFDISKKLLYGNTDGYILSAEMA